MPLSHVSIFVSRDVYTLLCIYPSVSVGIYPLSHLSFFLHICLRNSLIATTSSNSTAFIPIPHFSRLYCSSPTVGRLDSLSSVNSSWWWYVLLSLLSCTWFADIFLRILSWTFTEDIRLQLLSWNLSAWCSYQGYRGLRNPIEKFSLLLCFQKIHV